MRRLLASAAVAALGLIGLVGCGGGDDTSKEDFIAEADKVCKDVDTKGRSLTSTTTAQGVADVIAKSGELLDEGIRRLDEVPLPSDDQDRKGAEAWLNEAQKLQPIGDQFKQQADKLSEAAKSNDQATVNAATQEIQRTKEDAAKISQRSDELAKDYGLKECGANS
jgi:hypothetical protein